jgi:corrinoid protein of di/trimethylamine methyltransferase
MTDGMRKMGELFDKKEIFLPELLLASDALMDVMAIVEPELCAGDQAKKKKVIMGTVAGDLHEIGKNLVCMVMKANGYDVIDLGGDVSVESFINTAEEQKADVIGMSSLMTTTMRVQKEVIDQLISENKRDKYKVMIGGAPINQRWADQIGADAYCENAFEVVKYLDSIQ